jgi:hypothetical protein
VELLLYHPPVFFYICSGWPVEANMRLPPVIEVTLYPLEARMVHDPLTVLGKAPLHGRGEATVAQPLDAEVRMIGHDFSFADCDSFEPVIP